jgi:hypothetical protein
MGPRRAPDQVSTFTSVPLLQPYFFYSCLAHVINLATQKLISTYSKAPHFNPHDPTAHIPGEASAGSLRDEIGLVRAIAVKVRH